MEEKKRSEIGNFLGNGATPSAKKDVNYIPLGGRINKQQYIDDGCGTARY